MIPLIVSFHTGGPYAALAAQLEASVRRFEYECSIVEIASRGDYWLNCAMKPGFLAEWTRQQALSPSRPDEDVMGDVLRSGVEGLQVDLLPPGYLYVFDVWKKLYRNRLKPVILHKQASRASIPGRHRQHEDVAKAFRR